MPRLVGGRAGAKDVKGYIKPKKAGQKPIRFKKGGLHASADVEPGKKIPESKHEAAAEGKLGKKAEAQERFYKNVLSHGKGK